MLLSINTGHHQTKKNVNPIGYRGVVSGIIAFSLGVSFFLKSVLLILIVLKNMEPLVIKFTR